MVVPAYILNALIGVGLGVQVMQALSAAVTAMSKPKREDGFYAYWYRLLHLEINNLNAYVAHKYNVEMPVVVDESARQTVITPDSKIETAVTKTTTTTS